MGLTVYSTTSKGARIHATPDCPLAQQNRKKPMVERDLATIGGPRLCVLCFPDYPKTPKVWHPLCRVCKQRRPMPCPHNGAIRIVQPGPRGQMFPYWVWPERAALYPTLANPDR